MEVRFGRYVKDKWVKMSYTEMTSIPKVGETIIWGTVETVFIVGSVVWDFEKPREPAAVVELLEIKK